MNCCKILKSHFRKFNFLGSIVRFMFSRVNVCLWVSFPPSVSSRWFVQVCVHGCMHEGAYLWNEKMAKTTATLLVRQNCRSVWKKCSATNNEWQMSSCQWSPFSIFWIHQHCSSIYTIYDRALVPIRWERNELPSMIDWLHLESLHGLVVVI